MKLSIIIVTYNSLNYLKACLTAIKNQTFKDYEIIVIDNNSIDGSLALIKKDYPEIKTLKNVRNLGLCRANNQGIKLARGEYVLIMNPDVILENSTLTELIKIAEIKPRAGAIGPKLLRLINKQKSAIIDSSGLKVLPYYKIVERGAGEQDRGQYNKVEEVFGLTGACVLYKKEALEEIKEKEQYFDERFFVYKEDIDIMQRLKKQGWQNWYVPTAVAYHQRQARGDEKTSNWKTIKERRKRNRMINYYSYRNHLLFLNKHLGKGKILKKIFLIIPYEIGKFIYLLFFETRNIKGFFDFWKIKNK